MLISNKKMHTAVCSPTMRRIAQRTIVFRPQQLIFYGNCRDGGRPGTALDGSPCPSLRLVAGHIVAHDCVHVLVGALLDR